MKSHLLITLAICCAGCGTRAARACREHESFQYQTQQLNDEMRRSLFVEDAREINDETVAEILATRIPISADASVAVYNCSWTPSFPGRTGMQVDALGSAIPAVRLSKIPDLLLPLRPKLPDLRKAAARLQCEFVLIYSFNFKSVDATAWYELFTEQKQVVLGTIEAMLYDIRTGVVPFTATVDMTATCRESEERDDTAGWREQSVNRSIVGAMGELSEDLAAYIASRNGRPEAEDA